MRFITKKTGGRNRVIPISSQRHSGRYAVARAGIKDPAPDAHHLFTAIRHKYRHFPLSATDKRELRAAMANVKLTGLHRLYPLSDPRVRAYYSIGLIDKYLKALKKYHKVRHKLDAVHDDIARASLLLQKEYIHSLDDRYIMRLR